MIEFKNPPVHDEHDAAPARTAMQASLCSLRSNMPITLQNEDIGNVDRLRMAKVMMVDDEPITIEVMREFLDEEGYCNFVATSDSTEALEMINAERPDVLLLDLMMPDVNGFDILGSLRSQARYRHLPVIVLTSSTDAKTKLKALELGATDFLAKPVDSSELALRLRNTLAAKAYQDQLMYVDALTGMPNRRMLTELLDLSLRQSERYRRIGCLLHINVDRFKQINDALGPAFADIILRTIAERLDKCVRAADSLALFGYHDSALCFSRIGGDEFGLLLTEIARPENASLVAQRLLDAVRAPVLVAGQEMRLGCSIGISVVPADGADANTLLQNAGAAMRVARQEGGNTFRYFSAEINHSLRHYLSLQTELGKAIEQRQFLLHYQPKVDTSSGKIAGAEVLIRWSHPEQGMVRPDYFIPMAEETGLIIPIGEWALEEACRDIVDWQARGIAPHSISVNVSARQLASPGFLDAVKAIFQRTGVDPRYITLEITESILMENVETCSVLLRELKALGVQLSMDDFGTGYSSLSYLRRFPLDEIKIDRSFMTDFGSDREVDDNKLVMAIIALGQSLGMRVTAEGVETPAQYSGLQQYGCDLCQGYFFSPPVSRQHFEALLAQSAST